MQLAPVLEGLLRSLESQHSLGGDDPSISEAHRALADALAPALRLAAMELAEQAAAEVGAQLDDRVVEVVVVDGDPCLRVDAASQESSDTEAEGFDARLTLRLPPTLKSKIEDAATGEGDSVNSWVVDALHKRAKRQGGRGRRVTEGFDL